MWGRGHEIASLIYHIILILTESYCAEAMKQFQHHTALPKSDILCWDLGLKKGHHLIDEGIPQIHNPSIFNDHLLCVKYFSVNGVWDSFIFWEMGKLFLIPGKIYLGTENLFWVFWHKKGLIYIFGGLGFNVFCFFFMRRFYFNHSFISQLYQYHPSFIST